MGIDLNSMLLKKMSQMQDVQRAQGGGKSQAQAAGGSASSGSLLDRLNGLDNKLNQGGGVGLSDSGVNSIKKKQKM